MSSIKESFINKYRTLREENIMELKHSTLSSYREKAEKQKTDILQNAPKATAKELRSSRPSTRLYVAHASYKPSYEKARKRESGIESAKGRLEKKGQYKFYKMDE